MDAEEGISRQFRRGWHGDNSDKALRFPRFPTERHCRLEEIRAVPTRSDYDGNCLPIIPVKRYLPTEKNLASTDGRDHRNLDDGRNRFWTPGPHIDVQAALLISTEEMEFLVETPLERKKKSTGSAIRFDAMDLCPLGGSGNANPVARSTDDGHRRDDSTSIDGPPVRCPPWPLSRRQLEPNHLCLCRAPATGRPENLKRISRYEIRGIGFRAARADIQRDPIGGARHSLGDGPLVDFTPARKDTSP